MSETETFAGLIETICDVHSELTVQVNRAVNAGLTLRNWLIGFYIEEYQFKGQDRAAYGERLVEALAEVLTEKGISRCDRRELYRYCRFYRLYPQIVETLPPQLQNAQQSRNIANRIVETASPQSMIDGNQLVSRLSFSHIAELLNFDDPTKRAFYEIECLRGNWSVRELKRQIGSLYYERSGLSHDKLKLAELTQQGAEPQTLFNIRDPYVFEFLGLKSADVMSESLLEDQLLGKLQEFLLELGHGFCFEARQKRILIGDEHFFVDLVFYHRILKCHVLVELKLEAFSHANIGQLNTYVSWYRQHMMSNGDNPPLGILLCTEKNHALVEYALAGMDNQLFVSKYLLELPDKATMQQFIDRQLRELQA